MKKLKWLLEDANGEVMCVGFTREEVRGDKKWYMENIFEPWADPFKPPLKIIRQEWELVGKKEVR